MNRAHRIQSRREDRGSQLVEFAIVLLFLPILLGGVWDLGRMFNAYITIANAARDGVRYYSRLPCVSSNGSDVRDAVKEAVRAEAFESGVDIALTDITISPDPASTCPSASGGTQLTITVVHTHDTWLGGVTGIGSFTLTARARMRNFGSDV